MFSLIAATFCACSNRQDGSDPSCVWAFRSFSAAKDFFGDKIFQEKRDPAGLCLSKWGSTHRDNLPDLKITLGKKSHLPNLHDFGGFKMSIFQYSCIPRWFQTCFIFTPTWWDHPIWRAYFSDGLVETTNRYSIHYNYTTKWHATQHFHTKALIEAVAEPKISVVTALLPPRGPGQDLSKMKMQMMMERWNLLGVKSRTHYDDNMI